MNNNQNIRPEAVDILIIAGVTVCSLVCGILTTLYFVLRFNAFSSFILGFLGAVIALWFAYISRQKKRNTAVDALVTSRVQKTVHEELSKKDDEINKLKLALQAAQNGGIQKSPEQQLKELQEYQNSFPLRLTDGSIVHGMTRSEYVPNSHSRWTVFGANDSQLLSIDILRPDVQKQSEMLLMVKGTKAFADLPRLNITADQLPQ